MSQPQQIVVTKGRYQVVLTDGDARDAPGVDRDRYAVTTLGGAVLHRDLTFDEARAWLDSLFAGDTVDTHAPEPASHDSIVRRALRARR